MVLLGLQAVRPAAKRQKSVIAAPYLSPNTELEREWDSLVDGVYEIILDTDHKENVIADNLSAQSVDRLMRSLGDAADMVCQKS